MLRPAGNGVFALGGVGVRLRPFVRQVPWGTSAPAPYGPAVGLLPV